MTDEPGTICRRCGFDNVPGEQFCGSCGAFLVWESSAAGEPAGGSGEASSALAHESSPDQPPTDPGQAAWGAPYGDPLPPPPPIPAWPDDDEDAGDVPEGDPAVPRGDRGSGEPVATDAGLPSASPAPVDAASGATEGHDGGGRRVPGWLPGVAGVGLLVGVAIVLAGLALRGPGQDAGATGSADPSAAVASSAPETSGPSASSSVPGTPVPLALTRPKASSVAGDRAKFQPGMAIDGNKGTAWQEGALQEKDQWLQVAFDPSRADTLVIRNGYQASQAQFQGARRLKDVLISIDRGEAIPVRLKDTAKPQEIDLGGVPGATSLRITIVSTYPGEATSIEGSPFDDAAVSELTVLGVPGG